MRDYRNDPLETPEFIEPPEPPECCGQYMDVDGRCLKCMTCGNVIEIQEEDIDLMLWMDKRPKPKEDIDYD